MPFSLRLVDLPPVKRKNIDGRRYYYRPGDVNPVYYPSVSTVVSSCKKTKKAIHEWRARVGPEKANKISRLASARGNVTHKLIEKYILDDGFDEAYQKASPLGKYLFDPLRSWADRHLDVVLCVEGQLFSHHLRSAGTSDLVGKAYSKTSIVDWKSSERMKRKDQIENYFIQEAAYAVMFEEVTGIPVPQLVTVMTTEDGECEAFVEKRDNWIDSFIKLREAMD